MQPLFVVAIYIIATNFMCCYRTCLPPTMIRCIFHLLSPTIIRCISHLLPPTMICCVSHPLPPTMIRCIFHLLPPIMIRYIIFLLPPANERGNCDSSHQICYVARFLCCNGSHCMAIWPYSHVTME